MVFHLFAFLDYCVALCFRREKQKKRREVTLSRTDVYSGGCHFYYYENITSPFLWRVQRKEWARSEYTIWVQVRELSLGMI